jgi:hypothetical protein
LIWIGLCNFITDPRHRHLRHALTFQCKIRFELPHRKAVNIAFATANGRMGFCRATAICIPSFDLGFAWWFLGLYCISCPSVTRSRSVGVAVLRLERLHTRHDNDIAAAPRASHAYLALRSEILCAPPASSTATAMIGEA